MQATELANSLLDRAYLFGDLEVECCNIAGDLDPVNGVTHQLRANRFVVAVDPEEYMEAQ